MNRYCDAFVLVSFLAYTFVIIYTLPIDWRQIGRIGKIAWCRIVGIFVEVVIAITLLKLVTLNRVGR